MSGYMDDLQWAAPFEKMVHVIKFVRDVGPDYGYNLNMDKSIYLMAPIGRDISQDELFCRVNLLMTLGVPIQNIRVHPQCQSFVSPAALTKRRLEWGCKALGSFIGANEYVLRELNNKMTKIHKLTDVLIQCPKSQFRCYYTTTCNNNIIAPRRVGR